MSYLLLVFAALLRHKLRTLFTLLSILTAFLLFGLLDSVRGAFAHPDEGMPGANRMLTISKSMPAVQIPLPQGLYEKIAAVPGVVGLGFESPFGGTWQDPQNYIPVAALDFHFFGLYPEWHVEPGELSAFRDTRTGALAGESLARKYNWKVGDKIPLQTDVLQKNGSTIWTFDLVGTYRIENRNMKIFEDKLYIHWSYFDEARPTEKGTVGWFTFKVADVTQADRVARAVDALSTNSDHQTKTRNEQALVADYFRRIADMGIIVAAIMVAVFFTLVLLTGNAMAQAVRERIPELATLKAIGFPPYSVLGLVLGESILLLLLGCVFGLALSSFVVEMVRPVVGVPMLAVGEEIWLRGLVLAVLVGLIVGIPPSVRGMRLRIVDALSGR